jgi:pSer/pThr/pTyr-binding forkhead associated (FHA) protein
MHRLVVNPDTSQAWEIPLKPGENFIGRGFANDFKIEDASVSSSHCKVVVNDGTVMIADLGSTNGTFVNHALVQQATLQSGQPVRMGSVEMIFYSGPSPATPPQAPPMVVRTAATTSKSDDEEVIIIPAASQKPAALRVNLPSHSTPSAPPPPPPMSSSPIRPSLRISSSQTETEDTAVVAVAPPIAAPVASVEGGSRVCKFHPKSPARYLCHKCNRSFCEMCVGSRTVQGVVQKTCRSCGVSVVPLQVTIEHAASRSFYASIPGAFIYPFKGFGSVIVIFATIIFTGLDLAPFIWTKIAMYGLMFLYMQNIIHTTTSDEKEALGFPEADGLGGAALQLGGTVLMSFGLTIGLVVARFFDVQIPVEAIVGSVILGCLYFPMAFLAVAMKDSVAAGNPLVVIPSILKIPGPYLVTALLLVGIYGFERLGDVITSAMGGVTFTTRSMSTLFTVIGVQILWAFLGLYFLTVNMRILGLMYNSRKDDLGWF